MANKKIQENLVTIIAFIVGFVLIIIGVSEQERMQVLSYIFTVIGLIITIATLIIQKINSKKHNENKNQERDSVENDVNRENEKWWIRNWKWLMTVAVFIILVIVGLAVHQNKEKRKEGGAKLKEDSIACVERLLQDSLRQDSIHRCFGDLVNKFDNRMKQNLTYENAYQFLEDDYIVLRQIIQILENNPELPATSKYQYIDRFKNRADTAIVIINKAIYDTTLTPLECLKMSEKYVPQIKEIEQMRNDL